METLSKEGSEVLTQCCVSNTAGGGGVFVMHSCCCRTDTTVPPVTVTLLVVFCEMEVTGMCCCRHRSLSAVCLMTLVAMALQGCGGAGREGVVSGVFASTGCWSPDPESAVDTVGLGLDWTVLLGEISTKLGLWGGVMHREERDTKSLEGSWISSGRRESQESEAGVRGRGLQGFSLLLLPLRCKG